MNNREWLESLSDEELADKMVKQVAITMSYLQDNQFTSACTNENKGKIMMVQCIEIIGGWLQAEHTEASDDN